jgi:biopolymer transport protein ExbD
MSETMRGPGMKGVTPFIDMLFILLFGMLALSDSRSAVSAEQVKVRLPTVESVESGAEAPGKSIVIEVDAESRVRLDESDLLIEGPEQLDRALSGLIGEALPDEFKIEIRADADARQGVMAALLQHLRRTGFKEVSLLALGMENATWGGER